ncbi:MAG: ATP-binding response regulator [Halobacteriota archaeon]
MIRIVLVELDPNSAHDIQSRLQRVSYDIVATTATVDDVITRGNELKPDLILMDIRMKGDRSSIDAAREIKERHNIPIIFIAADTDVATVRKAIAAEPDGFLINPLDERELLAAIEVAISRHQKEQLVLASERRIRELTDALPEVVYETDADGAFTFVNAACGHMLGYSKEELLAGMTVFDVLAADDPERSREAFHQRMDSQRLRWGEYTGVRKDTSTFPISVRAIPIRRDGTAVGVRGIIVDTTTRKQAEAALQKAHNELEQRVKERTADLARTTARLGEEVVKHRQAEEAARDYAEQLEYQTEHLSALVEERTVLLKSAERLAGIGETAAMIGHDLRNPLQGLQYMLDLEKMREELTSPDKRGIEDWANVAALFDKIGEQIFYMDKIVGDLQDYARPITPDYEAVSIRTLISSVLESIPYAERVRPLVEIPDLRVTADPQLMRRVFANLILNAIQAMPNGGTLTISATADDGSVAIHVSDTGVGIPADMRDKLFSPLTTDKAKGTGLGLAVVKRIVDAHGGAIAFESEEGKGTTFTVMLPQTTD